MKNNSNDFEFFSDPKNEITPSSEMDQRVMSMIGEKAPSHQVIFAKLLGIQVVMGALTLLICPQFDLGLGKSFKIFHYIHHTLGMEACYAFCGAIFMGPSAFLSVTMLKRPELEKINNVWPVHLFLLAITMLIALANFGSSVENKLLFIWLFTAVLFSNLAFFFGKRLFPKWGLKRI